MNNKTYAKVASYVASVDTVKAVQGAVMHGLKKRISDDKADVSVMVFGQWLLSTYLKILALCTVLMGRYTEHCKAFYTKLGGWLSQQGEYFNQKCLSSCNQLTRVMFACYYICFRQAETLCLAGTVSSSRRFNSGSPPML